MAGRPAACVSADFADFDVPCALQANVTRHRANLARLVEALQSAGVDDSQIESSVNAVVGSYRAELVSAVEAFKRKPADV